MIRSARSAETSPRKSWKRWFTVASGRARPLQRPASRLRFSGHFACCGGLVGQALFIPTPREALPVRFDLAAAHADSQESLSYHPEGELKCCDSFSERLQFLPPSSRSGAEPHATPPARQLPFPTRLSTLPSRPRKASKLPFLREVVSGAFKPCSNI